MYTLQLVIEMVLATDMKSHFTIIGHFGTSHRNRNVSPTREPDSNKKDETAPKARGSSGGGGGEGGVSGEMHPNSAACRARFLLSLQMALKCSDLSHTFAELPVHLRWVGNLEEEVSEEHSRALGMMDNGS